MASGNCTTTTKKKRHYNSEWAGFDGLDEVDSDSAVFSGSLKNRKLYLNG